MSQLGKQCLILSGNTSYLKLVERWPSGRRRTPGKCVGGRPSPGFESLSLRHEPHFGY